MFVITADQIDSRRTGDAVDRALVDLEAHFGSTLALPAERTAGDEIQALTSTAATALGITVALFRARRWSIGVGVGDVQRPLGASTRASTGDAFYAARAAVDRAKASPVRFALDAGDAARAAADLEALTSLLLFALDRRTEGGWEVFDLLASGLSQAQAAEKLGITPGAVSLRVRTAGIRLQDAATPALVRQLEALDDSLKEDS